MCVPVFCPSKLRKSTEGAFSHEFAEKDFEENWVPSAGAAVVGWGCKLLPAKECSPPAVVQESAGFVPEYSFAVSHVTLHCADVLVPVHPEQD
eukprot:5342614-Amphidinium_carterae.1